MKAQIGGAAEKKPGRRIIALCLLAAWTVFIFHNSCQTADISSRQSGSLLAWLQGWLSFPITEHVLRKLAHFTEFAVEGIFLCAGAAAVAVKVKNRVGWILFFGMAIALTDETIQLFFTGRSGQVSDVWIDFLGVSCGSLLFAAIHRLMCKSKARV